MTGDVTVIGLQPVTCPLEDIAMDVPHGTSVVIPAEKAARSKDLWRAVSQRLLFKLDNGSMVVRTAANPLVSEVNLLRERVHQLEETNRVLEAANRALQAELASRDKASQEKLDVILAMLQSGQVVRPVGAAVEAAPAVVDVAPPPYIPSKIRSDQPLEAHVQTEKGSTEGADISEAASQLRRIRQRGGQ